MQDAFVSVLEEPNRAFERTVNYNVSSGALNREVVASHRRARLG